MMVIEYWQISGNGHHTEGKSWSMARPIVRRLEGREMKIIALDLGTKTGWAISTPELGVISGVQVFDVKRGESPGMRYLRFSVWMFELITQVEPNLMAYEAPHHRGGAATEILNGFSTRIQEYCADYGIEYQSVHTGTLKKYATGSGRASKEEMIAAAQKKYPDQQIEDDNQADALCILDWATSEFVNKEQNY